MTDVSAVSTITPPSLADQIFGTQDIESELIHVDVWDVDLEVRSMTARDRARLIKAGTDDAGNLNLETIIPDIVILCTYNPETKGLVFQPSDREMLQSKNAAAVEQVATAAMKLSGLGVEPSEAVEAAKKDSTLTPTDFSSTN